MADHQDNQDPKEMEALRFNFEQELARRNAYRANVLVTEGLVHASEADVLDYLNTVDEEIARLVENPDFNDFSGLLHFALLEADEEEREAIDVKYLLEYIEEDERFRGVADDDPLQTRDVLSTSRVRALIYREITGRDPIVAFTRQTARSLIEEFVQHDLPISDAIKKVLSDEEIDKLTTAWKMVEDEAESEEAEDRWRELKAKFGISEPTHDDRLKYLEINNRKKRVLTNFDKLMPDIRVFAGRVLNAKDGNLPV
jgi:hypothetical protein